MNWLTKRLAKTPIVAAFLQKEERFAHLNIMQEALLLAASALNQKHIVVLKANEGEARHLFTLLQELDPTLNIVLYMQEESLRTEAIAPSVQMQETKMLAYYQLMRQSWDICITYNSALTRKIVHRTNLDTLCMNLRVGDEMDIHSLIQQLQRMGYQRNERVELPLTYASRGGVVDIYSVQFQQPLRIEFFDTIIDSMRFFDLTTQRTTSTVDETEIFVASDFLMNADETQTVVNAVRTELLRQASQLEAQTYSDLHDHIEMDCENLEHFDRDQQLYPYLGFLPTTATILDYIEDPWLVLSSGEDIRQAQQMLHEEYIEYIQERVSDQQFLLNFMLYETLDSLCARHDPLVIHQYQAEDELNLPWHRLPSVKNSLVSFVNELQKQALESIVILALDTQQIKTVVDTLLAQNVPYQLLTDEPRANGLYIDKNPLSQGFTLEDLGITIFTSQEIFQTSHHYTRYQDKFNEAQTLSQLSDLKHDDYIVHQQYGVGQYKGVVTREVLGVHKDFLQVNYRNDDVLFVPLEQFNLVRKYVSKEAVSVRLNKLGSKEWEKTKARVKESVADIADRLITLYSERKNAKGYAFSKNSELHAAFADEFEYDLTADQVEAIHQVETDMESPVPMDRLLCGDVGFGKTEVALRAAFKAVADHKQVVYLCPTTILSAQHYRTFIKRFQNFPVKVGLLNRFVSLPEQAKTIAGLRDGSVDIVIGTHRVLSKDIHFTDLGLLIVDEEQRFGVDHKERIKEMRTNIDVLSLSATPIPRTLQMSLVGLRSLSQLNTPPSNRMPIMTYVVEANERFVDGIIRKELARDGQVFYLYNNIDRIFEVATSISQRIDNARIAVVHGRMERNEIEDVMMRFTLNEINILICTTIVETGIDIPNANTMIVDNAQNFGLAQLYQIKGRVGRSDRLAYAYLLIPEKKQLTEIASKRLQSIKEFSQLGSGYKIAMRDLTIRGAGELLGGNQSGFIDTVGIDMYLQLLQEVIDERQGKEPVPAVENQKTISVDGYIPSGFTENDEQKIQLYQRIEQLKSFTELKAFYEETQDIFGKLPKEVNLLLEKKRFEISLMDERIDTFKERERTVELRFTPAYSERIDGVALFEKVSRISRDIKVKYIDKKISITATKSADWLQEILEILDHIKLKEKTA